MTMTGEITIVRESWIVRLSTALTHWGRRRQIRQELAEIYSYVGEEERRANLEEQLLLDRERRAAQRDLDRVIAMSRLFRGI